MEYDEFGFEIETEKPVQGEREATPEAPHVSIRQQFPESGEYLGGTSDGWEYRTVFAGANLAYTYKMLREFLQEEGYGDIPLPDAAEDLKLFRRPRGQIQLFAERGYIHNPIKILFPEKPKQRGVLILCIYNERVPQHLLRFHNVL